MVVVLNILRRVFTSCTKTYLCAKCCIVAVAPCNCKMLHCRSCNLQLFEPFVDAVCHRRALCDVLSLFSVCVDVDWLLWDVNMLPWQLPGMYPADFAARCIKLNYLSAWWSAFLHVLIYTDHLPVSVINSVILNEPCIYEVVIYTGIYIYIAYSLASGYISLASGYESQHIVSWSASLEIRMVAAGRASGMKMAWGV